MIRMVHTVTLEPLFEASVMVLTSTNGIVQYEAIEPHDLYYQWKTALGVIDVHLRRPSVIIIANAWHSVIN